MRKIDIIIPVYHPDENFATLLEKLWNQTLPPSHVFLLQTVVEGEEVLQTDHPQVSVHPVAKKDFDHGGTRHFGATLSDAEFILFLTQDAMPADDRVLEQLAAAFDDEKTAAAYGRQLAREGADEIEVMTRLHNYPEESRVKSLKDLPQLGIKTYFCSDVCAAYRKSVYEELGGFVRRTIFNEDMIMASKIIQAGYQVAYQAEARVVHSHSYTCMQQFHRNFDLGVSQGEHPEIFAAISSEKEGAGYAGSLLKSLCKRGKWIKAFYFAMQCAFKLAGYKLGVNYRKLPRRFILWCTMSPDYWRIE